MRGIRVSFVGFTNADIAYYCFEESIKYIYEAPALVRMSLIEMQFIKKVSAELYNCTHLLIQ